MPIDVLRADVVDFDEIVSLQRECFSDVAGASQREAILNADYYRWKFTGPCGVAKIACLTEEGRMTAMCAAVPTPLRVKDKVVRAWQLTDFVSRPARRGNGWLCVRAVEKAVPEREVLFAYPNVNSMPFGEKLGFTALQTLNLLVGVVPMLPGGIGVRRVSQFGAGQDSLVRRLSHDRGISIDRSAAYMNHRYCSPRNGLYYSFIWGPENAYEGYIVVRFVRFRRLKLCMVMDCMATSGALERQLYRSAGNWACAQGSVATLALDTLPKWRLATIGFVPFPQRLSPRPLVLLVKARDSAGQSLLKQRWDCHLGDWDAF